MKIVCLGDSLTYGYMIRRSKIWTNLSQDKTGFEIINEGISGDTSGGMLCRIKHSVYDKNPQVVFIMGGINDLIAGADLGVVTSNIMSMTHQSLAKAILPIIGIPPKINIDNIQKNWAEFTDFNKIAEEHNKYHDWVLEFCKCFKVKYIDFYTEFEKEAGTNFKNLFLDGLHPNEEGHEIMAEIFCRHITEE
ncbi:GDSL-type esterase/lipase family protein [Sedimentibacter sp. MB31-C6]|uniref:GDSL-type esterase/lipase family protein n=1 Tax=Sedimentibacter sp. MB31-C6 TaxID=3109366 RepID=UPI002DDD3FB2|nr:GDSL-type esterase/lipase family protein [Sedimentibacter sp. MB36-C1]WSI03663.1 GDSL-type esterase/lipase family protein [Sedimentibacter sp. MB36-C1]